MYRIEFEPGDVGVFRSVEEVATAIKSGVITPRARIYHQATDKWLPIEFHPHYRKALDMVASGRIPAAPPAPSAESRLGGIQLTPSWPRPAIQFASSPAPAPVQVAEPEAAEPETVEPEAMEPEAIEPEPLEPEPLEPEPVPMEPMELEPQMMEPEPGALETEPAPPPPDFVFAPVRSRDIHFIPVKQPTPFFRAPLAPVEEPTLLWPAPVVEPVEVAAVEPAPEPHISLEFAPEESGRPMFRPRFRLAASGSLRRPILLAVGGLALIFSTHFGLSAVRTSNAGVTGLGWPSLPFLSRESAAGLAASAGPALNEAHAGGTLPRDPVPQGSPSFGASSAFPVASRAGSPADSRRQPMDRAQVPSEKPGPATADSIVRVSPLARQIAVAAPKIGGLPGAANGKLTPVVLVARYEAAYAAARAELETGFRTAGFANVFAPEHLSSAQGVRAARLSAGTASAYVAKYRRREAEIEAAYADSAAALAKSPADRRIWESRQVLQENPEVAKLSGFLLEEIDSVFGVLSSQDAAYELKDGAITFQDAAAAHAYAELRPWLDRQAHQWADTGSGPPSTAARVLRAIGSTRLPEGGAF